MVHGVPDRPEAPQDHPESHSDHALLPGPGRLRADPLQAVLFDFHGTLAQVEDPVAWVVQAARACGVDLERPRATVLADRLVTAGRAGGPPPYRVPPQLAEVYADRDLYEHAHRAAYTGLAATVDCGIEGLAEALYERLLDPVGWVAYTDTVPTLKTLRAAGFPVAVVSNVGFDIRPIMESLGVHELVGAYVLSYEVGRCKPDAAIFEYACASLRVPPERVLMVGDTPADAAAVRTGCRAYLVPAGEPGAVNGLGAVLSLLGLG
jgi:HAD superfamily hydrolase (TIGR01509 family)